MIKCERSGSRREIAPNCGGKFQIHRCCILYYGDVISRSKPLNGPFRDGTLFICKEWWEFDAAPYLVDIRNINITMNGILGRTPHLNQILTIVHDGT